jgi:hypothetical protein
MEISCGIYIQARQKEIERKMGQRGRCAKRANKNAGKEMSQKVRKPRGPLASIRPMI